MHLPDGFLNVATVATTYTASRVRRLCGQRTRQELGGKHARSNHINRRVLWLSAGS